MRLLGRQKIYTDVDEINKDNIVEVLQKAYAKHRQNVLEMQYLIDYERGEQPLQREKTVRSDIDIRVNSSLPNYIKKFKKGYNWGSPILLVQRGNKEIHNTDTESDDSGISGLNEILKNGENISFKDQQMAEFIEIAGIGHRMIEPKVFPKEISEIPESLVNVYTLDSRFAFMVYHNGPDKREMMGVSYVKRSGKNYFTCFTDTERFEIESGEIKSNTVNILGEIPIVEYERSVDRTGCFERKIKEIDALNILESDFANDVSQRTQELWWGYIIEMLKSLVKSTYFNVLQFPKMKNTLILHRYLARKKSPYIEKVSSQGALKHVIIVLSESERNTKTHRDNKVTSNTPQKRFTIIS